MMAEKTKILDLIPESLRDDLIAEVLELQKSKGSNLTDEQINTDIKKWAESTKNKP